MNLTTNLFLSAMCIILLIATDYNPNIGILCAFTYSACVVWTNAEKHQQVSFTRVRGTETPINYDFLGNMWRDDVKQVMFSVLFTVTYITYIIYLYCIIHDSTEQTRGWVISQLG